MSRTAVSAEVSNVQWIAHINLVSADPQPPKTHKPKHPKNCELESFHDSGRSLRVIPHLSFKLIPHFGPLAMDYGIILYCLAVCKKSLRRIIAVIHTVSTIF